MTGTATVDVIEAIVAAEAAAVMTDEQAAELSARLAEGAPAIASQGDQAGLENGRLALSATAVWCLWTKD